MSSQQQSPSYKRRSSGRRTRRTTTAPSIAPEVQDGSQVEATEASEPLVAARTAAKATSKNGATTGTSRSRAASKVEPQATSSPWKRLVNTDRFEGLQRFTREIVAENKKVIWPDRESTRNLTLVVIAVSVVLGILLGGIDYVLFQLFEALP